MFLGISCGNNRISIDKENAAVFSPDNYVLTNLSLEDDSMPFVFHIMLKTGCAGSSLISLKDIGDDYTVVCNDSVVANKDFRLLPDTRYSISNYSVPDAGVHTIEFLTDSMANVIRLYIAD